LAWTVATSDAGAYLTYIGIQDAGHLWGVGGGGDAAGAVIARIASDGSVPWQLSFDGGVLGVSTDDRWATGDGGAWFTWNSAILMSQGASSSGFCRIAPDGAVRTYANPMFGETLNPDMPKGLSGFASKGAAFLARGDLGGVFHLQPSGSSLALQRLGFVGQVPTDLAESVEPISGEPMAEVATNLGRHLVRWRKDGSVRWAKRIDGFSGLGAWRGLPGGGALVVLGPPTGATVGVVSCVASIGSDGNTLWVRDAIGLSTVGGHDMLITADGGAALWWGGRLMLVGAQGEFRSQRKLESPDGDIAAVVAKRSSGVVVAVRSPGLGGITFWSTDFLGANASTSCIMNIDTDLLAGVVVPNSITVASSGLVAPSPSVFTVTTVAELAAVPVVQLAQSRPIAGVDLGTTTPSCP